MRHGRRTFQPIAVLAALVASALLAAPASADSGIDGSSSAAATTPATESAKPVSDTTTDSKPVTQTESKPVTETTTESKPTTETTTESKPTTETTTSTPVPTTTPVPSTPELPKQPEAKTPTTPITDVPGDAPGGGGQLPFTGPGDVVLAVVIALLAGTGGILFLAGAAGREQLDVLNRRTMDSPSGFQLAYRELRKQQVD